MFGHKKIGSIDGTVIALGTIAFVIIVSFLLVIVYISRANNKTTERNEQENIISDVAPTLSKEELQQQYTESLESLLRTIRQRDTQVTLDTVHNELLSVRVPEEMKETHLQAVLQLRSLMKQHTEMSDDVWVSLESIIIPLIKNDR